MQLTLNYSEHTLPSLRKDACSLTPAGLDLDRPLSQCQLLNPERAAHQKEKNQNGVSQQTRFEALRTLNSKCFVLAKMLYNLKSGSAWKYWSYELSAFIMPGNFLLFGRATTSPSTMVVSAQSLSTLKPAFAANEPFRHMIRKEFSFSLKSIACSTIGDTQY